MFQAIGPISSECTKKNDRLICSSLPIEHIVEIKAPRLDILLVDFLSEALYLSDINDEAYLDVDVKQISEDHINAVLRGITVEGFEVVEIKAVTYHDLEIIRTEQGYQVDIVFDI